MANYYSPISKLSSSEVYAQSYYSPIYEEETGQYEGIYASGEAVKALQMWLNANVRKYGNKLKVDGIYGDKTRAVVMELQRFLNLTTRENLVVDGLYGCQTYLAALRHYKQLGWTPPPKPVFGASKCLSAPKITVAKPRPYPVFTGGYYASNPRVGQLQRYLTTYLKFPLRVDNVYGGRTRTAVAKLQVLLNSMGANLKVDGFYGCKTYYALMKYYKKLGWTRPPLPIFGNCAATIVGTHQSQPQSKHQSQSQPQPQPQPKPKPKPKPKQVTVMQHQVITSKPAYLKQPVSLSDNILGIDKKYAYIGGAVLIGMLALLLANKEG